MDLNLSGKVAVVTGASKGIWLGYYPGAGERGGACGGGSRDGSAELSELAM